METIIALLFVLLPLIFKLIGKKFEQAGQSERAERMRKIAQALGEDDEVEHDDDGQVVNVPPVQVVPVQTYVRPTPVVQTPSVAENEVRQTASKKKPVVHKKPILEEDVRERNSEKIDPKKLVIYSEIMKPKFTE